MDRQDVSILELKLADGGDAGGQGTFTGYGAVFGNQDDGGDVIVKGAFKETLREAKKTGAWPAMLLQHGGRSYYGANVQDELPIGIWTDLAEDDTGLYCEGKIATGTTRGREVYELLKMQPRPALGGLSIGYRAKEYVLGTKPDEPYRTIKKLTLFEVSLVSMPMNALARVDAVKSTDVDGIDTLSEAERFLREAAHFDRKTATAFVSRLKRLSQREAAGDQEVTAMLRRATSLIRA